MFKKTVTTKTIITKKELEKLTGLTIDRIYCNDGMKKPSYDLWIYTEEPYT